MTRWLLLVPAAALIAGCAGVGSSTSSNGRPLWCVDVDNATTHMASLSSGLDAQTVTTNDAAKLLGKIASDLHDVALTAAPDPVAPSAQEGSDDAGRIRVSLLGYETPTDADMTGLKTALTSVQTPCGDA